MDDFTYAQLKIARWQEIQARKDAVGREARQAAASARSQAFRMLSRERGGFTAKTRDGIITESNLAGQNAARLTYLKHGYTECAGDQGRPCDQLVSPGFDLCPNCTPIGEM